MNLVDIFIIGIAIIAAVHGVTQGAAMQVLSFGGFWVGMLVGAALVPFASRFVSSPFSTAFVSLTLFLGFAVIGGGIGRYLGTHAWGALRRLQLGHADAAFGAVVAVIAALAAVWLMALLLVDAPARPLARAVNQSAIVKVLVQRLPDAPGVFTRLNTFISATPFPRVFQGLEPIPAGPIELPDNPAVQEAARRAAASTVRVQGFGCGGIQTGSGFVAAPGIVITNAHVVAGIDQPQVEDTAGRHPARAILFDPRIDLAVLSTSGLEGPPLSLLRERVPRGQGGAVLGFPGGGQFSAGAAAVVREFNAIGRDIYGRTATQRNVYQLQAQVRQGNSGGPFVRQDGRVVGVIFAASTSASNIGYALTSIEVAERLDRAAGSRGFVDTGPCAA